MALIDASLMTGVPADVTASTGLDALTQCIEPFVSVKANFMTDVFAEKGIQLAAQALPKAFSDGRCDNHNYFYYGACMNDRLSE